MKVINQKINESLLRIKAQLNENSLIKKFADAELPMRAEMFSADQMEQYGKMLARNHTLNPNAVSDQSLLKRLSENEVFLFEVHNLINRNCKG
jgi:cyclic beta-1,2-glucan synthetase